MDLQAWLQDLQTRDDLSAALRRDAERLLTQLAGGIIPSNKAVERLRRALDPPAPCARINSDGSCTWLRRNGKHLDIPIPGLGERALCPHVDGKFTACAGYRKLNWSRR